ncbi:MAG: thioredoxin domain-containing protein [Nanoarchaeota archaeon]
MEKEEVVEIKIPKFLYHENLRRNPWIISTFVFAVLSLVLIFNSLSGGTIASDLISANEAGEKLVNFLSDTAGSEVTLKSATEENGLYKIDIDYQGNLISVYTTKDGNFLIQDLVPITSTSGGNSGTGLVSASEDDDAVLGNENAEVTIIEFSDYQCPFCRKFWTETYSQIKSEYIETGKVKLVFRDFPLTSIHPMAQASAESGECVREKGGDEAYFKMHDKMFSEQNILDSGLVSGQVTKTVVYTNDDLKDWAKEIGYDISSCLDSGKYKSEVEADTRDAQKAGGSGTPYFVINGKVLSGAQPFSAFENIIQAELN